jgi:hypothetical protein
MLACECFRSLQPQQQRWRSDLLNNNLDKIDENPYNIANQ